MNKIFIIVLALVGLFTTNLIAQVQQQQQQAKTVILKPTFIVEDIVFVYQTLDNIEITGNEVEPFLEVKKVIQSGVQTAQTDKKQPTETIQMDISLPNAQNLITFLSRAKFSGRNAEQFKRFVDAIVESSKGIQNPAIKDK
ncbi:MAG: hypothetical protein ABSG15_01275 [FCB group bacterium]|jgi:hypothetical protein